jgi:hypothetical protein
LLRRDIASTVGDCTRPSSHGRLRREEATLIRTGNAFSDGTWRFTHADFAYEIEGCRTTPKTTATAEKEHEDYRQNRWGDMPLTNMSVDGFRGTRRGYRFIPSTPMPEDRIE